jgi:cell division protein FtsI/penicillin-binding protein 2
VNGVKVSEPSIRHLDVPAEHWKAVQAGLDAVVNLPRGTGRLAQAQGVRVAGKTGTAQSGQFKTHAWFVGYAPADHPKVAMVVFLENGGTGGLVGAKMASNVFEWLRLNGYL